MQEPNKKNIHITDKYSDKKTIAMLEKKLVNTLTENTSLKNKIAELKQELAELKNSDSNYKKRKKPTVAPPKLSFLTNQDTNYEGFFLEPLKHQIKITSPCPINAYFNKYELHRALNLKIKAMQKTLINIIGKQQTTIPFENMFTNIHIDVSQETTNDKKVIIMIDFDCNYTFPEKEKPKTVTSSAFQHKKRIESFIKALEMQLTKTRYYRGQPLKFMVDYPDSNKRIKISNIFNKHPKSKFDNNNFEKTQFYSSPKMSLNFLIEKTTDQPSELIQSSPISSENILNSKYLSISPKT